MHSPSLGGPVPVYKPPVLEVVYVTSEQTTSRPVVMVPENTTVSTQTPVSAANSCSGSRDHLLDDLGDPLLQPSSPVLSPNQVYAQPDPVKRTVPRPPQKDDHVQYVQIDHQNKL